EPDQPAGRSLNRTVCRKHGGFGATWRFNRIQRISAVCLKGLTAPAETVIRIKINFYRTIEIEACLRVAGCYVAVGIRPIVFGRRIFVPKAPDRRQCEKNSRD